MAIKLIELDTSVRESVNQLGFAYNTFYPLYQIFRHAREQPGSWNEELRLRLKLSDISHMD